MLKIVKDNSEVAQELQDRYGMDQVTWLSSSRNTFPFNLSLKFLLYLIIALIVLAGLCPFGTPLMGNEHFLICLGTTLMISCAAYNSTDLLIQTMKPLLERRGICGKDLNKLGTVSEKEAM